MRLKETAGAQSYDKIYCYENGTLRNKFGITERNECEAKANRYALVRRRQIGMMRSLRMPICESGWNIDMLKDIHRALMGDMYEWAGEFRTVDVGVTYDQVAYEDPKNIERKLQAVFDYINDNNCFRGMDIGEVIKAYSLVFGNLKNLQPFRDGNTRTAIVFTQLLASVGGMTIDFTRYSKEPDLEKFRLAQLKARDNDFLPLTLCFCEMVAPDYERPELMMPKVVIGKQGNLLQTLQEIGRKPLDRNKILKSKASKGLDRNT